MDIAGISPPRAPGAGPDRAEIKAILTEDRMAIRAGLMDTLPTGGRVDRERLRWVRKADRAELWHTEGARNCAQWLSGIFHISNWKARRWIESAHSLESLPLTSAALEAGSLSLDKVVEVTRFATPATERKLISWARGVSIGRIRERGDEELRRAQEEAEAIAKARYLRHNVWDDHIYIEALLPAAEGAAVVKVIDDLARNLPEHPDTPAHVELFPGDEPVTMAQRRADALALLVTTGGTGEAAPPTIVVHAPLAALVADDGGCRIEGGGVLHPETVRRLSCDAKLQVVLEGKDRTPVGIGRAAHDPPGWLRRLVLDRDGRSCRFPGCEMKDYLKIHHIHHWTRGGRTDLDNLIALCYFHHDLVHGYRWSVTLDDGHRPIWFRPRGRIYEPGPAPPEGVPEPEKDPPRLAEAVGYSRILGLAGVL